MAKRKITRRNFIDKTTSGILGAVVASGTSLSGSSGKALSGKITKPVDRSHIKFAGGDFTREVEKILPPEKPYDYHRKLTAGPVHVPGRDYTAASKTGEMSFLQNDWKLVWNTGSSIVLQNAVQDFQDYMDKSMGIRIGVDGRDSIEQWKPMRQAIIVGTRDQMPGCGLALKGPQGLYDRHNP